MYRPTPTFITALMVIGASLAFALLLTACGGGGDEPDERHSALPANPCAVQPLPPACL